MDRDGPSIARPRDAKACPMRPNPTASTDAPAMSRVHRLAPHPVPRRGSRERRERLAGKEGERGSSRARPPNGVGIGADRDGRPDPPHAFEIGVVTAHAAPPHEP